VVDDDPDFCVILKDALSLEGHEVKICTEGPKAMEIVGKDMFDIAIIADIFDVAGRESDDIRKNKF